MQRSDKIRVLVVDDSAFMRKSLKTLLESDPEIEVVDTARDGEDAVRKVKILSPDVVTLDIEMPRMNGLQALQVIMRECPLPVIIISSLTEQGARETMIALEMGALDYIPKNLAGDISNIVYIKDDLIRKVKGLYGRKTGMLKPKMKGKTSAPATMERGRTGEESTPLSHSSRKIQIVAIGASTGGPMAIQKVLSELPKDFPVGILIVQHMPPAFTGPFAERLGQVSRIRVREARDGDPVEPGTALVAHGGHHMRAIRKGPTETVVGLSKYPPMIHTPSVDVMMSSVAQAYSDAALGVIMTGMGHDGQKGMKAIKEASGKTMAQNEESCVVFGMPKAAIEIGVVDKIVPLDRIAGEIVNMV